MYAYIHQQCGKPAFILIYRPVPGARATSANVLLLNYQPMEACAEMVCESCGTSLSELNPQTSHIRTMI